jgi:hypothetical protein
VARRRRVCATVGRACSRAPSRGSRRARARSRPPQTLGAAYLARGDAARACQTGAWLWQLGLRASPDAAVTGALVAWRRGPGDGGALAVGQVASAHVACDASGAPPAAEGGPAPPLCPWREPLSGAVGLPAPTSAPTVSVAPGSYRSPAATLPQRRHRPGRVLPDNAARRRGGPPGRAARLGARRCARVDGRLAGPAAAARDRGRRRAADGARGGAALPRRAPDVERRWCGRMHDWVAALMGRAVRGAPPCATAALSPTRPSLPRRRLSPPGV